MHGGCPWKAAAPHSDGKKTHTPVSEPSHPLNAPHKLLHTEARSQAGGGCAEPGGFLEPRLRGEGEGPRGGGIPGTRGALSGRTLGEIQALCTAASLPQPRPHLLLPLHPVPHTAPLPEPGRPAPLPQVRPPVGVTDGEGPKAAFLEVASLPAVCTKANVGWASPPRDVHEGGRGGPGAAGSGGRGCHVPDFQRQSWWPGTGQ